MKFIQTSNWVLINVEEIVKIEYEQHDVRSNRYDSYFYLKDGEKHEAFESLDTFQIDDDTEYYFDAWCHKTYSIILLTWILENGEHIICVDETDEVLWPIFLDECRLNIDKLRTQKKQVKIEF